MTSSLSRGLLIVVLCVTFVLEVRYAWLEWGEPPVRPIRPIGWTEEQEDLAERPKEPLRAVPVGGPLTSEGLGLASSQVEVTLPELMIATRGTDLVRVRQGIIGLRRLHDPAAVPRVAELIEESLTNRELDPIKKQLVWTLGVLAPRADAARWSPLIEKLLADPEVAVRDYAAFALARLGSAKGAELTAAVLDDPSRRPITRGRAALALADGGFVQHAPRMEAALAGDVPCELGARVKRALVLVRRRAADPRPLL